MREIQAHMKSLLWLAAASMALVGCSGEADAPYQAPGQAVKEEKLTNEERIARIEASSLPPEIKQQKLAELRGQSK
jgi:hypothetical protein